MGISLGGRSVELRVHRENALEGLQNPAELSLYYHLLLSLLPSSLIITHLFLPRHLLLA